METKYSKPFVYEFITEKEVMNAANDLVKKGQTKRYLRINTRERKDRQNRRQCRLEYNWYTRGGTWDKYY